MKDTARAAGEALREWLKKSGLCAGVDFSLGITHSVIVVYLHEPEKFAHLVPNEWTSQGLEFEVKVRHGGTVVPYEILHPVFIDGDK